MFRTIFTAITLAALSSACSNSDTPATMLNDPPAQIDSDNDGLSDTLELQLGLNPASSDTDSDGVPDGIDRFPDDPNASRDSDNDGVADERDQFPNDPSETTDLNADGLGDNSNPFEGTVISGTVTDSSNAGIRDAQVTLELINNSQNTNPIVVTNTNTDGRYNLVADDALLPDSFVVVVSAPGYLPAAIPLNSGSDDIAVATVSLSNITENLSLLEAAPLVHHLGDDSYGGSENSQFQRRTEGPDLTRNFNLSSQTANAEKLYLHWVAKGIQRPNELYINGTLAGTTFDTDANGYFTLQSIELEVSGLLAPGANSLRVQSVVGTGGGDIDDFEFVFINFSTN